MKRLSRKSLKKSKKCKKNKKRNTRRKHHFKRKTRRFLDAYQKGGADDDEEQKEKKARLNGNTPIFDANPTPFMDTEMMKALLNEVFQGDDMLDINFFNDPIFNDPFFNQQQQPMKEAPQENDLAKQELIKTVSYCVNTGKCLAFGEYASVIKHYLNNFDFLFLDKGKIKLIGNESANGMVLEAPFVRDNLRAYTAIKISRNKLSDNLYYEYLVGKLFINSQCKKFPCFVETYKCFTIDNMYNEFNKAVKSKNFQSVDFISLPTINEYTFSENDYTENDMIKSCEKSNTIGIMIQHFDNFITIKEAINNKIIQQNEIYNIFYQVYFALEKLKQNFTHYDLHYSNVALYKPYLDNRYIDMEYYDKNTQKEIKFKSQYIVKILDYGRSYFSTSTTNSAKIIEYVCQNPVECENTCGDKTGYGMISQYSRGQSGMVITNDEIKSEIGNISHDLRLPYIISINNPNLFFGYSIKYDNFYGTKEMYYQKIDHQKKIVYNIVGMKELLEDIITKNPTIVGQQQSTGNWEDSTYNGWEKAATLKVYNDDSDYIFKEESSFFDVSLNKYPIPITAAY